MVGEHGGDILGTLELGLDIRGVQGIAGNRLDSKGVSGGSRGLDSR